MAKNPIQLAHLFDVSQCVGCKACIVACTETNYADMLTGTNTGWQWLPSNIRIAYLPLAKRPKHMLMQCQQCSNAPCVNVCPFGANYHDPATGLVKTAADRCVGCGYCVTACPYDVRWMNPKSGLPVKCMGPGCEALVQEGQAPACVAVCPVHARSFGDINDEQSEIHRRIQQSAHVDTLLPEKGTHPNFFVVY